MTTERPMHPRQTLGERLRDLREARDWTQGYVADSALALSGERFTQGRLSSWERGAAIAPNVVEVLARVYEVDPGWLSHGEASAAPAPKWLENNGTGEVHTTGPRKNTRHGPQGPQKKRRAG